MNERLLQYIWQFQHFAAGELLTTAGEPVQVIQQGQFNTNQGPDFSSAKIKIGSTTWVGSVELHIRSSDWDKHKHQYDRNYDNVILHVVWEDDGWSYPVPVLELKGRVPGLLLNRYERLMDNAGFIPCAKNIDGISELSWTSWKDRLMAERLERKSALIHQFLEQNENHWEEATWWMTARNFGIKVNAEAFEAMARSLPVSLLAKQKHQLILLEALLMGQAGQLGDDKPADKYYTLLQREYRYQQIKYQLRPITIPVHFLRMRPGNFPTVRLAQLAVLLFQSASLFAKIKETRSLEEIKQFLILRRMTTGIIITVLMKPRRTNPKDWGRLCWIISSLIRSALYFLPMAVITRIRPVKTGPSNGWNKQPPNPIRSPRAF